ncbi:Dps family protein [Marinicrinis sediminis]|uniref:Dps family protein n=1 Tax=Marinicrinis sediminis TaxID=1652465 RepID=A0ABW5RAG8_9BACL
MTTATATKQEVSVLLNQQVANFSILFVKLHHYHWFVKGTSFFKLHETFEAYYDEAAQVIDDLAERILTIGGKPQSRMSEYLQTTTLQEASGNEQAAQMVQQVKADFEQIVQELGESRIQAEDAGDQVSGDMLLGIQESLEKHIWMLHSFLSE